MTLHTTKKRAAALAILTATAATQMHAFDWMTVGNDAQRSFWFRSDPKISVESFKKPAFALEWKLKPENSARQLNSLMPVVMLDFYISYRGFRTLAFVAGSGDRIVAFDTELGREEWSKNLSSGRSPAGKTLACPGGITSGATRPVTTAYPLNSGGGGGGRGTPAKSGVGLPDQGAVTLKPVPAEVPVPVAKPAPKPPVFDLASSPYAPQIRYVMTITGDGKLHRLWVSNGNETKPAVPFLPAGAHAEGLIAFDNTAYAATVNKCGGVEDGIWALDLTSDQVNHWKLENGSVAGTVGPAVGPDGKLYVSTTAGELVALEPKTLKPLATQKMPGVEFTSSPVVFDFQGKDMIAVAAKSGSVYVFDAATLGSGTPVVATSASPASGTETGALTSWVDKHQTRWILQASGENIIAWKMTANASGPALEQGWKSRELVTPLTPLVTNNVVFALSSGEFQSADSKLKVSKTVKNSKPAVLYALDGETGKELWNSGQQITSFVHSGGLAAGDTRVYLADYDGNQYAFGIPMEH